VAKLLAIVIKGSMAVTPIISMKEIKIEIKTKRRRNFLSWCVRIEKSFVKKCMIIREYRI
jgi:hypothetical protein